MSNIKKKKKKKKSKILFNEHGELHRRHGRIFFLNKNFLFKLVLTTNAKNK